MSKHQFNAEIGKVLNLVIHSIYTNKDIFIRELISNASDACDKFRYLSLGNEESPLEIKIKLDKNASKIIISDNGIGMNEEDLVENLGNIAYSGTQKFIEQMKNNTGHQQIGQFGVGFYSSFIVANNVIVYSTKYVENKEDQKTFVWSSDGENGFEVQEYEHILPRGTTIELTIKPEECDFIDKYRIRHIISTYSDHIAFPIKLTDENGNEEILNTGTALWIRPKSEISENEYNEFYRHVSHSPDTPWMTIHNKIEGVLEYTSLLYIPKNKPFDLFHQDRKSRVKLYIKRVFITDDTVSIMPSYLRFIRGIVDSNDLPLNISRENLQYNNTVNKIKKSLVKKILSELKKKIENDTIEFTNFWKNFGEVIKEGLCENALEEKEQILDICHFYTSKSEDEIINLQTYIDRMVDGQDKIYYLTGYDIDNLRKSPQIESFINRGIEVLLLKDPVDDFWIQVVNQYKNYELKNVIHCDGSIIDNDTEVDKLKNKDDKLLEEKIIKSFKDILSNRVKDVRISKKLISSPSCLSVPEGSMSGRMEKILLEQKQLYSKSAKILEININHPILKKLSDNLDSHEIVSDIVEVIFGQACISDGEIIDKPHDLISRINRLIV
ncbi:molecular chaperone HtpG [Lyticum sinuosum]|uniref:Chaperone protein HtpG n=1 Tax=Lyticum sinuosum TaxID=1332059 RepID=A0AAE4VL86_9RICK|nr:molecular chaperone HtpG [Lyticum sinuosum]MDZ5761573.1 Chaperone protein HtpG [Lyticum sinuosum]